MCGIEDVNKDFGYGHERWNSAKDVLRKALWEIAARESQITYGEATRVIEHMVALDPHDSVFHHMLGQISVEEDRAGRGMLSALVVHKGGDGFPGPGFFDLGQRSRKGYKGSDKILGHGSRAVVSRSKPGSHMNASRSEIRECHRTWDRRDVFLT
jgi:hypothetical protein